MPRRNLQFYTELVVVTVLSLVAANSWIRLVTEGLNRFYPGSLKVDFFVAVITTLIAVMVLNAIFADDKSNKERDPESDADRPGLRHSVYAKNFSKI